MTREDLVCVHAPHLADHPAQDLVGSGAALINTGVDQARHQGAETATSTSIGRCQAPGASQGGHLCWRRCRCQAVQAPRCSRSLTSCRTHLCSGHRTGAAAQSRLELPALPAACICRLQRRVQTAARLQTPPALVGTAPSALLLVCCMPQPGVHSCSWGPDPQPGCAQPAGAASAAWQLRPRLPASRAPGRSASFLAASLSASRLRCTPVLTAACERSPRRLEGLACLLAPAATCSCRT